LALDRISSHPVECHYGTTQSTLDGDTRAESFFNAEINAVLIRRSIVHLGLSPYIRRFKTEAGCTLTGTENVIAEVCFGFLRREIPLFTQILTTGNERTDPLPPQIVGAFQTLAQLLADAGWVELAGKSSLLSGGSITLRLFTLPQGKCGSIPRRSNCSTVSPMSKSCTSL
jgi:hypothetical protein